MSEREDSGGSPSESAATFLGNPIDLRPTTIGSHDPRVTTIKRQDVPPTAGDGGFRVGELALGRYQIVRRIKGGQEAEVFEGVDSNTGDRVFVKQLYESRSADDRRKRLATIKERMLALRHENLVEPLVLDLSGARICEVYAYAEGTSLSAWRKQHAFSPSELKEFVRQIASALHCLHQCNLAHRDVKPENITVVEEAGTRRFLLTDFGLLVATDEGGKTSFAGTDIYFAPEMVTFASTISRDASLFQADWWALGRATQEMIAGRDSIAQIMSFTSEPYKDARDTFFDILSGRKTESVASLPGMIELMEFGQFEEFRLPLRGLLTANPNKRWRHEGVTAWLAGGTPSEYYDEPLSGMPSRHFIFADRKFSLSEIARYFAESSHWDEGERQIRGGLQRSPLRRHIADSLEDAKLSDLIKKCNAVAESLSSATPRLDPKAIDAAATALALTCISGGDPGAAPMPLVIRGKIVDANYLAEAALSRDAAQLELLQILLGRDVRGFLAEVPPAGFDQLTRSIGQCEAVRQRLGELSDSRVAEYIGLSEFASVIGTGEAALDQLKRTVTAGRAQFRHTGYSSLQTLLTEQHLDELDLRTLAFVFRRSDPTQFKLVTYGEFERSARDSLTARRANLILAERLTWRVLIQTTRAVTSINGLVLVFIGFMLGLLGRKYGLGIAIASACILPLAAKLTNWLMDAFEAESWADPESLGELKTEIARLLGRNYVAPFVTVYSEIRKFNRDIGELRSGGVKPIRPTVRWQPLLALLIAVFGFSYGPVWGPLQAQLASRRQMAARTPAAHVATKSTTTRLLGRASRPVHSEQRQVVHVDRSLVASYRKQPARNVPKRLFKGSKAAVPTIAHAPRMVLNIAKPVGSAQKPAATRRSTFQVARAPIKLRASLQKRPVVANAGNEAVQLAGLAATAENADGANECTSASVEVVHKVSPRVPQGLSEGVVSGISGIVQVTVDASGSVTGATLTHSTGSTQLDAALIDAARASTFSPATQNCNKKDGVIDLTERFL